MRCLIVAHKGVGLEMKLSGRKDLNIPASGSMEESLTGDQVGHVQAYLESQERHERLGPGQFGGRVEVLDKAFHAGPPAGSKRWLEAVARGEAKPTAAEASKHEADILATRTRLGVATEDEASEAAERGLVSRSVAQSAGASAESLPPPKAAGKRGAKGGEA